MCSYLDISKNPANEINKIYFVVPYIPKKEIEKIMQYKYYIQDFNTYIILIKSIFSGK